MIYSWAFSTSGFCQPADATPDRTIAASAEEPLVLNDWNDEAEDDHDLPVSQPPWAAGQDAADISDDEEEEEHDESRRVFRLRGEAVSHWNGYRITRKGRVYDSNGNLTEHTRESVMRLTPVSSMTENVVDLNLYMLSQEWMWRLHADRMGREQTSKSD
jgi:hypothetical protein